MTFMSYGFAGNRNCADPNISNPGGLINIQIMNSILDRIQMTRDLTEDPPASEWNFNTIFMAEFLENLLAGNIAYSLSEIEKIRIKRRKKDSFQWVLIAEYPCVDESSLNFIINDLTNRANTEYDYAMVPVTSGDVEGNYSTTHVLSTFNGIYMVEDSIIYSADLNASLSTTRNFTTAVQPTLYRKYPFVQRIGRSNYITGQMQASFIHMSDGKCEMDLDGGVVYREQVADFLTNGRPKIIKYNDGRIYLAGITGQITENNDNWQAPVWSIEFTCVGDAENEDDLYNNGFVKREV